VRLLVGLGNPGPRYVGTRHNFGFEAVDRIARQAGASWSRVRPEVVVAETRLEGESVLLAKPQSYMNLSGWVVAELVDDSGVDSSQVVVFYDDIALPLGTLRIRERGGDGGHRGLASVLEALGGEEVPRVRLGIRPEYEPDDFSEFVLAPFSPDEKWIVSEVLDRGVAAARSVLRDGMAKAMSLYNATPCSS
jgi:PTH1 family peptidyl-tRNA hydrolase